MADATAFSSFCPRCDKRYSAPTQIIANGLVRAHLVRNDPEDPQHVDALEQWDDMQAR